MKDTRVVYGVGCTYWDDIANVGNTATFKNPDAIRDGLPCCPHCGGMLFEKPDMTSFMKGVDEYEKKFPGYRKLLKWMKGQCFVSIKQAQMAYINNGEVLK